MEGRMADTESDVLVREVADIVERVVRNALERQSPGTVPLDDPFLAELLRDERFVRSTRFERSLRSSLGSAGYEEIARVVAKDAGAQARRGVRLQLQVTTGQRQRIDELLAKRHNPDAPANWESELEDLRKVPKECPASEDVTVDLQVCRGDEHLLFFMKTVKPNLDQTREAKRYMLFVWAHQFNTGEPPLLKTYFALPYNPFGEGQKYTWRYPWWYFDMHGDPVLIGRAFWDLLGGEGTYERVLRAFRLAGEKCRELVDEFFNRSSERGI